MGALFFFSRLFYFVRLFLLKCDQTVLMFNIFIADWSTKRIYANTKSDNKNTRACTKTNVAISVRQLHTIDNESKNANKIIMITKKRFAREKMCIAQIYLSIDRKKRKSFVLCKMQSKPNAQHTKDWRSANKNTIQLMPKKKWKKKLDTNLAKLYGIGARANKKRNFCFFQSVIRWLLYSALYYVVFLFVSFCCACVCVCFAFLTMNEHWFLISFMISLQIHRPW